MALDRLQPPAGGMNTDASPDYVGNNECPLLENFMPGRPGKAQLRGPIAGFSNAASRGLLTDQAARFWTFGEKVLVCGSGGTYKTVTLGTGAAAAVVPAAAPSLSAFAPKPAKLMGRVYGQSTTGNLLQWNPTTDVFTTQTNGPTGFVAVATHLNRLFVLNGTKPGGGASSLASLYWCDPGATDTAPLAAWQDDVSGLTNEIVLPDGDFYFGLARCGRNLLVLGIRSVVLITGDAPSNFSVRIVARDWGLGFTSQSIVESEDGVYWMTARGLVFYDGATFTSLSDGRVASLLFEPSTFLAPLSSGHLLVGLNPATDSYYIVDVRSSAWSKVSSALLTSDHVNVVVTDQTTALWDGTGFLSATYMDVPEASDGRDSADNVTYKAIQPRLESRWLRLGSPAQLSKLGGVFVDYAFAIDPASAQQPDTGFRVSLRDTLGTTLLATTALASEVAATPRRQRARVEVFGEADAVQLVVDWDYDDAATAPPDLVAAEVYDVFVDYEPTRTRGTR